MSTEWFCISKVDPDITKGEVFDANDSHPLKQITVTILESRGTRKLGNSTSNSSSKSSSIIDLDPLRLAFDGTDPLTQFAKQESMDPLSQMAAEYEHSSSKNVKKTDAPLEESVESWSSRRSGVLNKYTTAERLSIVTSFLSGGEMIKSQTTMAEKVKHRLEQLDDFEEGSYRMLDVTQQEYVLKIEQLNQELVQAWNGDHRVTALKIAIQCSKLLADTSVMQFYPSQFVLITDILDIFGKLVYDRLKMKAGYVKPGSTVPTALPDNFTPDMVPETAKETCQNWFYKIASIRELLPRFYVETAILKCYSFLTTNEFCQALLRLTKIIRGIGDPLVAIYARCYLCRVGMTVTSDREYIKANLYDFLFVYHTMFNGGIKSELTRQRLDMAAYLSLYTPALDWIMQGVAARAPETLLDEILDKCQEKKNNGLLLNSILSSFKPDFIAYRASQFLTIISSNTTEGITQSQLIRSLGSCLVIVSPPYEQRQQVLKGALNVISSIRPPAEYISSMEMWAQFGAMNFGLRETNIIMEDVLAHMGPNRAFENHYHELQSVMDKIVTNSRDLEGLLSLDNFLPLLDLFQKESVKLDVCRNIMTTYKNKIEIPTNDPVLINALMYICRVLNDSVNALTVDDEIRQISILISHFIRNVNFGRDFESQLTFYVEARAAFLNLDPVYETLIYCVNNLAVATRKVVKGQHTRKTGAFVKACAAYCFITIPSILSVTTRMDLYLLSGNVALMNTCLGQADACFEAALNLISELPKNIEIDGKIRSSENYLVSYVSNFLTTLIIVPDSPDQGVLYLLRLLLEKLKSYHFEPHTGGQTVIYLHILDMLSTASQDIYPHHIINVVSNDELYGSDPKFIAEINLFCSHLVDQILFNLKALGDQGQLRLQSQLAMELFIRVVTSADVTNDKLYTLAVNLWNLAMKNKTSFDPKFPLKVFLHIEELKRLNKNNATTKKIDELLIRMKNKL